MKMLTLKMSAMKSPNMADSLSVTTSVAPRSLKEARKVSKPPLCVCVCEQKPDTQCRKEHGLRFRPRPSPVSDDVDGGYPPCCSQLDHTLPHTTVGTILNDAVTWNKCTRWMCGHCL